MSASFAALDVETANADLASICQIGIVTFVDGCVDKQWQSLVDPQDEFSRINIAIHGIDERRVQGAPRFCDIAPTIAGLLENQIIASHMPFDRIALSRAQEKYQVPALASQWLDTARMSRRTWPQFAQRGYGLANLATHCGITLQHHNALDDARAAGQILLRALAESDWPLSAWVTRASQPIGPQGSTRTGNPDGELAGEVVVFTGTLSMPRREASDLAAAAGCAVAGSVGKQVTLLVVGDQDIRQLGGHEKSTKHRKAEELIGNGQAIRILTERDFRALVG